MSQHMTLFDGAIRPFWSNKNCLKIDIKSSPFGVPVFNGVED